MSFIRSALIAPSRLDAPHDSHVSLLYMKLTASGNSLVGDDRRPGIHGVANHLADRRACIYFSKDMVKRGEGWPSAVEARQKALGCA